MVQKKEGGAKTFSKVGDVDGGPAPKGSGTAAISVYCCSACWTEENAAYCPVQFRVVRATPAEDAREKRPADLEVPMNLPYLADMDPDFTVTIGSGPNRCRCLFLVRPPRLALAEGLRPSRLLRV